MNKPKKLTSDAVREIPAVRPVPAVREVPLITVHAINSKILEQLYPTRGELNMEPYPDLDNQWQPVGMIRGDVLLRHMGTREIRLCWLSRYCLTRDPHRSSQMQLHALSKEVSDSLPTIYIA